MSRHMERAQRAKIAATFTGELSTVRRNLAEDMLTLLAALDVHGHAELLPAARVHAEAVSRNLAALEAIASRLADAPDE